MEFLFCWTGIINLFTHSDSQPFHFWSSQVKILRKKTFHSEKVKLYTNLEKEERGEMKIPYRSNESENAAAVSKKYHFYKT